ncbi:enoyl-CoA hydratase/isomerase family protein [Brevibacterium sp. CFH 10365]|uniref:enoyl-CoA hydratase/isomerase family protein n=1 Tax=Brevibacterium sp. CFH 10365 TaxID=2585207 RepID=UPI001266768D|nr:enoyl-CoA hydratase/isomerase family protein [Brevibacterium sp. CFH 10365]
MISQDRTGDILTITIDNASQANALTEEMLDQLIGAFIEAGADESLRAVLLTSTGGCGFSAGMDTTQFAHSSASRAYETIRRLGEVCEAIKNCALPVAVAIEGYCIGGAVEIAAAADFRIGGSGSWYAMPEVRIGIPSVLESVNLHRLMGWTKATEFILTGNRFTAEDMLACGFLNEVVDSVGGAEEAASAVEEHALALLHATMQSDRGAIAQQKRLLRTWKNTFEREAVEDSKKEFAIAFARQGD